MRNILVLGSPRSGTSLTAGLFAKSGYFMGDRLVPPSARNPKGYFEDIEINAINDDILIAAGARVRDEAHQEAHHLPRRDHLWLIELPLNATLPPSADFAERIERFAERRPWCFKDPRLCYTAPVWRAALGDCLTLCVFRDPAETVVSMVNYCRDAPEMADYAISVDQLFGVWNAHYEHVLAQCALGDWLFVHWDSLFDPSVLAKIAVASSASVDRDFADRRLHRSSGAHPIPARTQAIYADLLARAAAN